MKGSSLLRSVVLTSEAAAVAFARMSGALGELVMPTFLGPSKGGSVRGGHKRSRSYGYHPVRTSSANPKGDLAAAHAKRERKAAKLQRDTMRSHVGQGAHNVWPTQIGAHNAPVVRTSLHPFYVNRG